MRIIEIRENTIQLEGLLSNATISFESHTVSLVAVITDQRRGGRPVVGFGFNSIGRFAQGGILRERIIPRIMKTKPYDLLSDDGLKFNIDAVVYAAMKDEKPGGHGDRAGAVASLELALWDLNAKLLDEPAYQTIRGSFGLPQGDNSVPVYAAGGYYYAENSLKRLTNELRSYQDLGYRSFKIKVGGLSLTRDLERIHSAIGVAGAAANVAIDANGSFQLDQAQEMANAIEPLGLLWYEEPCDPLDFSLNRIVAEGYKGKIATGENLFSMIDTKNLIQFGGMRIDKDIFQMDPGLSYGLTEYGRMLGVLESSGYKRSQCYPHGGHLINLHVAAGLGLGGCEAYPGVFQPIGGYTDQCELVEGRISPSDAPGFGLEQKTNLYPYLQSIGK